MLKNIFYKKTSLIILILFVFINSKAQDLRFSKPSATNEIVDYTETFYGKDDRLINGKLYHNTRIILKGHPNFLSNDWANGPLFIKGITYNDVKIKYDIELDRIILLAEFSNGSVRQLVLNNSFVDSLYIKNHLFVTVSNLPNNLNGLYEPIYNKNFNAYVKHEINFLITKKMKSEAGLEPMLIGRYSKPSTTLYLHINDDFVKISNKKDLLLLFISKKKEISRFIQRNRINFKHANNSQLINLLKYCDDISSKPNNEE